MQEQPSRSSGLSPWAWRPVTLFQKFLLLELICADPQLSAADKVVALVLVWRVNVKTGQCDMAVGTIAATISRRSRTVTASISKLVKYGWVARRLRRGSTQYILAFHRLPSANSNEQAPQESAGMAVEGSRQTTGHALRVSAPKKRKGENEKQEEREQELDDELGWLEGDK